MAARRPAVAPAAPHRARRQREPAVRAAAGENEESVMRPERIYDSHRLATAYAYDRPAIHRHIVEAAGKSLHITTRLGRALDIGCGAGLSTAALAPLAESVVGLEPAPAM